MVYVVARTEPQIEPRSSLEIAILVRQFKDPLAAFLQVNLNLTSFVVNNPLGYIDPRGLDWLSCMANCVAGKDPLNSIGEVCLGYLGVAFPKPWTGYGRVGGPITTLLSWLSLGKGTAASGANVGRLVGRAFSPVWVTYGLYLAGIEAACAGTCAGDPTSY